MSALPPEAVLDAIPHLLRHVTETTIRPRFGALARGDIHQKSPGELVTIADREAEAAISAALAEMAPGIPVIGEEAVAEDPALLATLEQSLPCWLLDPLDGTGNFIAGRPDYGTMLAFVDGGEALAAWIWQPEPQVLWQARKGAGAVRNGDAVTTDGIVPDPPRGAVLTTFLPPEERAEIEANPPFWQPVGVTKAAAFDYPAIIAGQLHFIRWGRLLPWDHAPGALILSEAGGVVRRMDGSPYRADATGLGILAAASPTIWDEVRARWP